MSSRRSFLGAAAAALSLPLGDDAEADPHGSNPGVEEPEYTSPTPSTETSAQIHARTTVDVEAGSVSVRSIRFTRPGGTPREAELVATAEPVRLYFSLGAGAVRQLRDALAGDRDAGAIDGAVEMFSDGLEGADVSLAVNGDQLELAAGGVEAVVVLDEEVRADLVSGLDAALAEPATVEE